MSTALTQTTLSAPLSINSNVLSVASATGIAAPVNNFPQKLYVIPLGGKRGELMTVVSVSGTQVFVTRLDEFKMNFPSGSIVVIAPNDPTVIAFHEFNPVGAPGSSGEADQVTPYINVVTGDQYLIGLLAGPTGTDKAWVPGWNTPGPIGPTAAVASAAGAIVPSGPLFHVTGTAAVTGFTLPVGFTGGLFTIIPDGVFTWTTAGNIGLAGTAVVSKALTFTWDPNAVKWYPSYIA